MRRSFRVGVVGLLIASVSIVLVPRLADAYVPSVTSTVVHWQDSASIGCNNCSVVLTDLAYGVQIAQPNVLAMRATNDCPFWSQDQSTSYQSGLYWFVSVRITNRNPPPYVTQAYQTCSTSFVFTYANVASQ